MEITKDDYINRVRDSLDNLTEEVAIELVSLGSMQNFTKDNDIFEAIHAYLGSFEAPISNDEKIESLAKIKELIEAYEKEKKAE